MSDNKEIVSLSTPQNELEQRLIQETNIDDLKDIINIFNLNIQKKNILRSSKLSDLQDKIYQQMYDRLDSEASEFSNRELLDYFRTVQESLNKSDTTLNSVDLPAIQIHQNQFNVNVNSDEFNRESRARIFDAIQSIINSDETNFLDSTAIEENNDRNSISTDAPRIGGGVQEENISFEVLDEPDMGTNLSHS